MPTDMFANLSAVEAEGLTSRAWREAVRCWAEARACEEPSLRAVLIESAQEADGFWEMCRDAASRIRAREEAEYAASRDEDADFITRGFDVDEPVVTEADLAARHEFEMDGGNYHGDGSLHTGDDDGYHVRHENGQIEEIEGGKWLRDVYGIAYWSPTGEPGEWSLDEAGLPTFTSHKDLEAAFMRLVDGEAPHTCDEYRLPDGDCEVCWLASK